MTENELIKKCKDGHIESFELLIEKHKTRVYNIALKMLGNEQDAYDASQEVFLKIYKSIDKFKEQSAFSTWVYRVTTNVCLDIIRKNKDSKTVISMDKMIDTTDSEVAFEIEDKKVNIEEDLLRKERQKIVQEAIMKLNPEHRKMLVLREFNGMSYDEIAKITKMNLGTVKSKINRARISLKELLLKNKELFLCLVVLLVEL